MVATRPAKMRHSRWPATPLDAALAGHAAEAQVPCSTSPDGDAVQDADAIPTAGTPGPSGSMPTDFLQRAARNVRIASLVIGSLWLILLVMNDVVFPLWFKTPGLDPSTMMPAWPAPGRAIAVVGVTIALVAFGLTTRLSESRVIDLGLAFEVATAFLIGVLEYWHPRVQLGSVSPICIIILAYPAIAPATPSKTVIAGLVAASMSPLGLALAHLRGVEITGTPYEIFAHVVPNYLSAGLAVVPAVIIRRLGRQVQSARDLGSYRLDRLIGAGGMGEVYRATHRMLARPAAIKLMRPEMLERRSPERARIAVERFRREAEAAARLRSPHTIELYDFGISDAGVCYYVMELLDGVDLDRLVEQFGPVPAERAIYLLRQACDSLAEAHAHGLMHRDIKPSNIHTCRMGLTVDFVKVLDFGLVKPQPGLDSDAPKLTATGANTPGTPAFMAPESVFGDPVPDLRADIYALGCVGYWLVTGALVFDAVSAHKMLMHHVETPPEAPSRRATVEVPPELDAIILACLAKRPEERPASARELADRLAACPQREAWTAERAHAWWEEHLPQRDPVREKARAMQVDFPAGQSPTVRPGSFPSA
jgi:eukaryotic-like serine/threonine-protein kinase